MSIGIRTGQTTNKGKPKVFFPTNLCVNPQIRRVLMLRKNAIWGVAVLTVIALFGTPEAKAGFNFRIEQVSGSGGPNFNGAVIAGSGGVISYNVGNVTTGPWGGSGTAIQQPPVGGLTPGQVGGLDLNSLTVSVTAAGTFRLLLAATDYTGGANGSSMGVAFAVGGTSTGLTAAGITFKAWANSGNAVPNLGSTQAFGNITGNPVSNLPPAGSVGGTGLTFANGAFSNQSTPQSFSFIRGAGNWSLFLEVDINFAGAGTVSFDAHETVSVPEPATIAAALTGLPFLGGFLWRRRKTTSLSV
jgi:hypothetical protein